MTDLRRQLKDANDKTAKLESQISNIQARLKNSQVETNKRMAQADKDQKRISNKVSQQKGLYEKDMESLYSQQNVVLKKMKKTLKVFQKIEVEQKKDSKVLRKLWADAAESKSDSDVETDDPDQQV